MYNVYLYAYIILSSSGLHDTTYLFLEKFCPEYELRYLITQSVCAAACIFFRKANDYTTIIIIIIALLVPAAFRFMF